MWQRLRPWALGVAGVALFAGVAEAAGPTRSYPQHRPSMAPRPTARPAAKPAPAQPAPAQASHHKLRNRDEASFHKPVANSAWQTLGFGKRFFKVGDAWRMAWSFRKRLSILKRRIHPSERQRPRWSPPVYVDYRVSKVVTQDLGGHKRQVATITAIYDRRVRARMQHGNELKLDQYLNPVERCAYTKWTPHGTCRDRDTRSVIRSMGSVPLFIGDLERITVRAARPAAMTPALNPAMARVAKNKNFLYVPVSSGKRVYAHTYWAQGDLMPTYVQSDNIQGVLVGQRKIR